MWALPARVVADQGFTLVELLVVLVLISLLAGITVPAFVQMNDSAQRASERDQILSDLAALPYRAHVLGKSNLLKDASPLPFDLPAKWHLRIPHPISYRFTGVCEGGEVVLVSPDGVEYRVKLVPPRCQPQL